MRIISGIHKGRRLIAPRNLPTRPTTDFTKESLFNILTNQFYFDEITVLDLFAGTGSISYEFASRGVPNITAIDSHQGCIRFIEKTAEELAMPIHALKLTASSFLETTALKFDVIFADPPYDFESEEIESLIDLVFSGELLHENGVLIVEHTKRIHFDEVPTHSDSRKYGDSVLSFFRTTNKEEEEE